MGGGKGAVEYWAAVVRPGLVLFEITGVTEKEARGDAAGLAQAAHPVPIRASRQGGGSLMYPAEIRNLSQTEVARHLDEAHHELFNLRFQYAPAN